MTIAPQITPLAAPLGAVVQGLDTNAPVSESDLDMLRAALSVHLLLLFRGRPMSPQQLLAFAAHFGKPVTHAFVPAMTGHDQVTEIRKEPDHLQNFGGTWHSDLSFMAHPPSTTLLLAKELPARGGDTLWSNQQLAYDSLPAHVRSRVDTLSAEHTSQLAFADGARPMTAVHPLAPIHPLTGRRYLYANLVSIRCLIGTGAKGDETLLSQLYAHAIRPEFQYRHRWEVNDMLVWDNKATLHMAMNDYVGERRVMHRVAVTD